MSPSLLLQGFFGLDADRARPLPTHTLRTQRTALTGGGSKLEASALTFSGRPIIVRRLPRGAAHFHLL
jgi:hypothetical protein